MAKRKKKKSKSISILQEVDKNLDQTYDDLMEEIQAMQIKLSIADQKAKKKAKKSSKKNGSRNIYDNDPFRISTRKEMIREMEGTNFFDRIEHMLKDIAPIITIIARLVASLILAILSMDVVKLTINPNTLTKMNKVYKAAMSLG